MSWNAIRKGQIGVPLIYTVLKTRLAENEKDNIYVLWAWRVRHITFKLI